MVLRKRFKGGYQVNVWMGDQYHFIEKLHSPSGVNDEFIQTAKKYFGEVDLETNQLFGECYGFVIHNFGKLTPQKIEPLYIEQDAWVISPDGTEFANLTFR